MIRKKEGILLGFVLAGFLISGILFWQGFSTANSLNKPNPPIQNQDSKKRVLGDEINQVKNQFETRATVTKVVDGDTIEVSIGGENFKVRYIGIDTPETVDPRRGVGCFGKEASLENKRLIEGKQIILEKDISETDKYGRLLRYIYLELSDGNKLFVNDYLVRQGFANASSYPPDVKFSERFNLAQKEARENNRGLWEACPSS